MSTWNGERYRELLDDICEEHCNSNKYCILKEFLTLSHHSPRLLMQMRCIEKYKWTISEKANKDVGWADAFNKWVEDGYAKKFGDLYTEEIKFAALYKKIMAEEK